MLDYTIYCTSEQTKKALELGAPIVKVDSRDKHMIYCRNMCYPRIADYPYAMPTTEQILNWFEDKSLQVTIRFRGNSWYYDIMSGYNVLSIGKDVSTRKEATLNAIDTALEYLINNQK